MKEQNGCYSVLIAILLTFFIVHIDGKSDKGSVTWAIKFDNKENIDPVAFANEHSINYNGPVGILDNIHLFSVSDSDGQGMKRSSVANNFASYLESKIEKRASGLSHPVAWHEEQIPKKREKRDIQSKKRTSKKRRQKRVDITDPLYPEQWHLHGDGFHLNTLEAWNKGYLGNGIRIAIVDDGIETTHPDLIDNVKLDSSWNFNEDKNSPDPTFLVGANGDWHGTASAGAAAGRNDGEACGVGVAPHAQLAGIAILQNNVDVTDSIEAMALSYKNDKNHIYSNSWGPVRPGTDGHQNEGPGILALAAIERSISEGRDGLGSIYVWAAGNDGSFGDNCNYDGYANMRYSVLIGSTEDTGLKGSYSEPCAALLAVTPGGTITPRARIVTTDLMGLSGRSNGNCTTFAGTSASCPLAAGVVALILNVNPDLTWLEVQYVLADSTNKHNDDSGWKKNGAGRWVSHKYGWGLLDAGKAVMAAKKFDKKIEEYIWYSENTYEQTITNGIGISTIICNQSFSLHHVDVQVWTDHPNVSKTKIALVSPSATLSMLAEEHDDESTQWQGWRFLSRMHFGETSLGNWILTVSDDGGKHKIQKWRIVLYGDKSTLKNE